MINLLPPQQKEIIKKEKNFKLFSAICVFVVFFLLISSLLFLFVNYLTSMELSNQREFLASKGESSEIFQIAKIEDEAEKYNNSITKLNSFNKRTLIISDFLKKVSGSLPKNIYLTGISFNQQISKDGIVKKISLQGFSPTRDSLIQLKRNLEKEETFKNIDFPSFNWVKPDNINFSVSFEI